MSIGSAYKELAQSQHLISDPAQQSVVDALDALQSDLLLHRRRRNRPIDWILLRARRRDAAVPGIYLWGGVGRGKTFLMDLFFTTLKGRRKKRIHFHRMMSDIHARLKSLRDVEDPLDRVASDIAGRIDVLCFDEFFVSDIADAMILGKLLEGLFRRGVVLVATSNTPPAGLYANGLQRDRFLPAIALLEQHTRVIEIGGDVDYRLRLLRQAGTYLTPGGEAADSQLDRFFDDLASGEILEAHRLDINGREICTRRCAKGIAWFDFTELCDGPRSQQDYIELARWYPTIIVSDVPVLDRRSEDAARRFIALVDEFYDRKVKLLISSAAPIASLYQGSRLEFEFRRTYSRLFEMQTADYLHQAHLA
jgi:cell division protein ZapE